ncbi:MAG: phosphopyruvate hydratase [Proteobacteria bacterium]|nr:phosphopyruvate hydratase [Pseudomonadota bacterium]
MAEIIEVFAREILDSRGNPTIEVDVELADGTHGRASVASGASTGVSEAIELRDKDIKRYGGRGVMKAINGIRDIIAPEINGIDATAQDLVDRIMCHLDDTENKAMLGANAILGVSLAVAKAAANSLEMPLYRYLGGVQANSLPVPVCNIINGGMHVDNELDIQEFAIAPVGLPSFSEAIRASSEVFHAMRSILHEKGLSTAVVDEGGFAPQIVHIKEALDLIMEAIQKVGYVPGVDFFISLDCAASEFYCPNDKIYELRGEGLNLKADKLAEFYDDILSAYPIFAIEDAFDQNDWTAWKKFTSKHKNIHVFGDDLFVTNVKLLQKGIESRSANGIVIKPNQVGTLTETLDAIRTAQRNGFATIISHRSGETEDTFIADLCVATNSRMLKAGGMSRSERIAKYNQLLRIEEELGEDACYVSKYAVRPNEV